MSRRNKVILMVLLGGVGAACLLAWGMREPRYQGRTLTSWLEQCSNTPLVETQRLAEARSAVRAIGAERALPYLLKYASAQDGPVRSWMVWQTEKWRRSSFRLKRDLEIQQLGIAGFGVLETNAAPAVPQLTRLLSDTNHAFTAVRCLANIGVAAKVPVCQALTNGDWRVRHFSAQHLARVVHDPEECLTHLKGALHDGNSAVKFAAVQGVCARINESDLAIPLLIVALEDKEGDGTVASTAAKCLGDFGSNALGAFGPLTNAIARGKPATAAAALHSLVKIAPGEALPVVIENLQSHDVSRRQQALGLLCKYPLKSAEIQSAIERATADADSRVALRAKQYITRQQRELRKGQPLIPDEPSHGGKRLGEWLKERGDDYVFTGEAYKAIREMGTNAIPALLERLVYVQPPYGLRDHEINTEALFGLAALGGQARSALPKLEEIMEGPDEEDALHGLNVIVSICGLKSEVIPYLFKGLTNQHADVRNQAVSSLRAVGEDSWFKLHSKQAVPILLKLLEDTNEIVRLNAMSTLREIDPEAARKAEGKMTKDKGP